MTNHKTPKLTQTALAKLLGCSQQLVSHYKAQGMPTTDAETARAWMRKYVAVRVKTPFDRIAKQRRG
jgi:predicted transcriptional regulator